MLSEAKYLNALALQYSEIPHWVRNDIDWRSVQHPTPFERSIRCKIFICSCAVETAH